MTTTCRPPQRRPLSLVHHPSMQWMVPIMADDAQLGWLSSPRSAASTQPSPQLGPLAAGLPFRNFQHLQFSSTHLSRPPSSSYLVYPASSGSLSPRSVPVPQHIDFPSPLNSITASHDPLVLPSWAKTQRTDPEPNAVPSLKHCIIPSISSPIQIGSSLKLGSSIARLRSGHDRKASIGPPPKAKLGGPKGAELSLNIVPKKKKVIVRIPKTAQSQPHAEGKAIVLDSIRGPASGSPLWVAVAGVRDPIGIDDTALKHDFGALDMASRDTDVTRDRPSTIDIYLPGKVSHCHHLDLGSIASPSNTSPSTLFGKSGVLAAHQGGHHQQQARCSGISRHFLSASTRLVRVFSATASSRAAAG